MVELFPRYWQWPEISFTVMNTVIYWFGQVHSRVLLIQRWQWPELTCTVMHDALEYVWWSYILSISHGISCCFDLGYLCLYIFQMIYHTPANAKAVGFNIECLEYSGRPSTAWCSWSGSYLHYDSWINCVFSVVYLWENCLSKKLFSTPRVYVLLFEWRPLDWSNTCTE